MGLRKLLDAVLCVYFLFFTLAVPLYDYLVLVPSHLFPNLLIQLNSWYTRESDDYLAAGKPHFFVGLVAFEILVQWPLSFANFYGLVAKKSWFSATCLIFGVSYSTTMVAMISEMIGSQKATGKMWVLYIPFLGFGLLAVLRGIIPFYEKTTSTHIVKSSSVKKTM